MRDTLIASGMYKLISVGSVLQFHFSSELDVQILCLVSTYNQRANLLAILYFDEL